MNAIERCRRLAQQDVWCIPSPQISAPGQPPELEIKPIAEGFYLNPYTRAPLFALQRMAWRIRPDEHLYLSLESVLSECGWISQMPMCLTILTSGPSERISTIYGDLLFEHTDEHMESWRHGVQYRDNYEMWVATPEKALQDLQRLGHNLDLVIPEGERE